MEKDRLRKHRERKRLLLAAAKQGEFEPELLEAIYRKRDEYVGYHAVAAMHPQAPSFLSCAPDDTRFFDANVLIARKLLGFAGGAVNPNSVSRQLHRLGHYNDRAVNNLRSRVAASMVRLDRMHKMNLPGEKDPIFPPLNVAQIIKGLKPPPTD